MPRSQQPAYAAVTEVLRSRITTGQWQHGTRLPSCAALASELGVGDNLVQRAQETLIREGLLEGRTGSGTYAASPSLLLHLDPDSQFGVRPAINGHWTVLCRRPGPVTIAYFSNDQPTLLARATDPTRPGTPALLRAATAATATATAATDDALALGLLRAEPVTLVEATSRDGETSPVSVPARYWDIAPS
ncbi:GntR family transcriptional regulator [Kitasatospora sp. NPDC057223]|uniref:GntR family transcriptional regulator n=1 Tax=Kitasatospora sp. NPDC057223 TaxID=3346055 RepID=UPI00362F7A24